MRFFFLIIFPLAVTQGFCQKSKADSLLRLIPAAKDTAKIEIYSQLATAYYSLHPDSFFIYSYKGLALAESLHAKRQQAQLYIRVSSMLTDTGNYELARKYADKSLAVSEEIHSPGDVINAIADIGRIYDFQSDFVKASEFYFKAMAMAEQLQDRDKMAFIGTNLTAAFYNQGDFKKCEQYALQTLANAQAVRAPKQIFKALELLGAAKAAVKDTAAAASYYAKSLAVCKANGYELNGAAVETDLARLQKDEHTTLALLLEARAVYDRLSPGSFESIDNWQSLAETYMGLHKPGQADRWLDLMVKKCRESGNIPSLNQALKLKAEVAAMLGRYQLAYQYNNQYQTINDSIFSQDNKNKIAALESQRAIDLKNKEIENKQLQLGNQQKKMWLLISVIVFLASTGVLIYRQSLLRKKTNTTLLQLNNELDEANKVKAKFFGILSHDLRSPVANLINFLQLQKRKPGLLTEQQIAERENKIGDAASSLLDTMEAMLLWSKGQMEHFKPRIAAVEVNDLFIDLQKFFSATENISFDYSNETNVVIQTDKDYLQTIMQNLTSNAVKALADTQEAKIIWKAWIEDGTTFLSITDNGPGAKDEDVTALYDDSGSKGTRHGLGLHIIRDLAKAISCTVKLQPQNKGGTSFILTP